MSQLTAQILNTAQETLDQFHSQLEPLLKHCHHGTFDDNIDYDDFFITLEDYFHACIEAYRMTHDNAYLKRAEILTTPLAALADHEIDLSDPQRFDHLVNNFTILSHHDFKSAQGVTTAHKSTQYAQYDFPELQQVTTWLKVIDDHIQTHHNYWPALIALTHYFYASIENFQHNQNEALLHERLHPFAKDLYKCYLVTVSKRLHHRHLAHTPAPEEHELLLARLWRDYHFVRDHNYDALNQMLCPTLPKETK